MAFYSQRTLHSITALGSYRHMNTNLDVAYEKPFPEAGQAAVTLADGRVWITGGFPVGYITNFVTKTRILDKKFYFSEVSFKFRSNAVQSY